MAVKLAAPEADGLLPIAGIRLATVDAEIKNNDRDDMVLIEAVEGSQVAAVYTQNAFCAAPVIICKRHQSLKPSRYLLINAGNANAGTGEQGYNAALRCCEQLAKLANVDAEQVLPFSTGVIGQQLPLEKMTSALPSLFDKLASDNWFNAANGIMTTDTIAKAISKQIDLDGQQVTITGIAKGSGMIQPNMATMLSYVATDAAIDKTVLDQLLKQAVNKSFNRITVDGDTSTNDACVLIATAKAKNQVISDSHSESAQTFYAALVEVMQYLAHAIVRDGEGATKFICVDVEQGETAVECRQVAYTIAHSPLVKTAMFASDPNWGRILAAVGRSGLSNFDLTKINIYLGDVCIIRKGEPAEEYTEEAGQTVMDLDEIDIKVELGRGEANDTVWTCDFSYDYVKINAEYRT
jgi:glutamate N-acetyltransferase/amino-acid N-acetyltransferase